MKLRIFRSPNLLSPHDHYISYDVPPADGITILDALFYIRNKIDDSLAFRYSCRGAVCGSCAMLINKLPRLACKTQAAGLFTEQNIPLKSVFGKMLPTPDWEPTSEILIEPLPNFKVIKDLVVDLAPFWEKLSRVKPWITGKGDHSKIMTSSTTKALERVANCLLCASCVGACPINAAHPEYLGPAALAQAWRYLEDPADASRVQRLELLRTKPEGVLGCEYYYNCVKVCPRNVAPAKEIKLIREQLKS